MWHNKKIHSIKWNDYFNIQPNKMIVYRVTPHSGVTNNTNKELWSMLHQLYSVYHKAKDRRTWKFRGGFKVTKREKDTIWFDIVFKNVKGEKKIEFYGSTTETWSKKFKETIEDKLKVTLKEVAIEELRVPDDALIQDLKYLRHDIFSMKHKYSEQTTPIGSIMSAVEDVSHDGDFARLSICNETEDRVKFAKLAEWAHDKVKKGKTPQRPKLSTKKVANHAFNGITIVANEIVSLLSSTFDAVQSTFGMNKEDNTTKVIIENKNTLESELGKHRMSNYSLEKRNDTVWMSRIRVAAHTQEKLRTDLLANTISSSFSEIGDDNELHGKKIRFRRRKEVINELNTMQLSSRTKNDPDVNRISSSEIGKIAMQLPTAQLQRKHENELNVNRKVETEIPKVFIKKHKPDYVKIDQIKVSVGSNNITYNGEQLKVMTPKQTGLLIGDCIKKGVKHPIQLPTKNPNEFYRGYVFSGEMGMGKDIGIMNFVVEGALHHNISFVVIDQVNKEGREGMANGIRDSLPSEKIVDLDFGDEDYLPPLDLTEVMRKLGRKGADRFANELIDFFGDMESMGQSRKILRDFAKASDGSLYNIKRLLEDESFREETVERLNEEGNMLLANEIAKYLSKYEEVVKKDKQGNVTSRDWKCVKGGQKALDGKANAILNRLDEFFGDTTLFQLFAQPPVKELDFEKWMREGKVIICRVPDRILSVPSVRTLVHWITLKTLMTRLLMSTEDQKGGAFMVFNEPQTYLNEGLANLIGRIATQGRKERLGALVAVQYYDQLGQLTRDFSGGGVNWFVFRSDETVYTKLKHWIEKSMTIEEAMDIEKWHSIVCMKFGGNEQPPFLVKMLEPPYKRYQAYDNSFLTKRHSRQYGRHFNEIDKLIMVGA